MRKIDVQRAWRDGEYYLSLTEEERAQLPANPAGLIELGAGELAAITGGVCTTTHQSWCYNSACATKCSCLC